jgi:protease I
MLGKHKSGRLSGKTVAILATDGFEQSELFSPKEALENEGARVEIVSIGKGEIKGWDHTNWGKTIEVTRSLEEANSDDYDCLMIPGGVINPDSLRKEESAVDFARSFLEQGKPVAAICHAPQLLIETGLLTGRQLTSYVSIKTDLINAGANWVDKEVIVDNGLVTSRNPGDIPVFCKKMIEEFEEGRHQPDVSDNFSASL